MTQTRLDLRLKLPRTGESLRQVRAIVNSALASLELRWSWRHEIAQAVNEACGNAVRHAAPARSYDLHLTVTDVGCHVSVSDTGRGMTGPAGTVMPSWDAEGGRGLPLIARLVDRLRVSSRPRRGTTVYFTKHQTPRRS